MRVLVLHSQVPFAYGGAEVLVDGLVAALRQRGHQADTVALPYRWNPPDRLLGGALAWRMIDVEEVSGQPVDLVVCTKFPTWAAKHPRKVLWLVHQHRQAYDLFGTPLGDIGPQDAELREAIYQIDAAGIGECSRRFAISHNVAERLRRYSGFDAAVLYPPVETRELWPETYEPFILSAARLDAMKRVKELLQAWPGVDASLRLVVASDGPLREELTRLSDELGIAGRVKLVGRVSDEELARLFRTCRAVYYAPYDEDYGYAAVEAHAAGKPVITASDAGGVLEFVEHDRSGQVSGLDPQALAAAVNVYADRDVAERHGAHGRCTTPLSSWDAVVAALLDEARAG